MPRDSTSRDCCASPTGCNCSRDQSRVEDMLTVDPWPNQSPFAADLLSFLRLRYRRCHYPKSGQTRIPQQRRPPIPSTVDLC